MARDTLLSTGCQFAVHNDYRVIHKSYICINDLSFSDTNRGVIAALMAIYCSISTKSSKVSIARSKLARIYTVRAVLITLLTIN